MQLSLASTAPALPPEAAAEEESMSSDRERLERACALLRADRAIGSLTSGIALRFEGAAELLAEGEVESITVKRLALELLAAFPSLGRLSDRVQVRPAAAMSDREIEESLGKLLLEEPCFRDCALHGASGAEPQAARAGAAPAASRVELRVAGGVVSLGGEVPTLWHKRMAGVFAWWIPGSRDVVNALGVASEAADSDSELADAVRWVLEKDPFIDASQIRVTCKSALVALEGTVPSATERELAEFDAWYLFGVDRVENQIEVRW
jgi:hypothetical protein